MTPYPTYPWQAEQAAETAIELRSHLADSSSAIKAKYDRLRDQRFPGWRQRFDSEMKEWLQSVGYPMS